MKSLRISLPIFSSPSCLLVLLPLMSLADYAGPGNADFAATKEWGDSFASKLVQDLNVVSNFDRVRRDYGVAASSAQVVDVDYVALLNSTASKMRDFLRRRVESLKESLKAASRLINDFPFNASMGVIEDRDLVSDYVDNSVNARFVAGCSINAHVSFL